MPREHTERRRLVAIHQPNFLPWLGYFDKLARADVFVVLDTVQFPKKGGTWTNRVRMLMHGKPAWVTVPVDRNFHGHRSIREMRIEESRPWREKLLKTIHSSYARTPAFEQVFPRIAELIGNETSELARYNINALTALSEALGLDTGKLVIASDLSVSGAATDLLIEIVRAVGGDSYLAGGGAAGYQEDEKFPESGIELVQQDFKHPTYPQPGPGFVEGLSVVDALMSCGFEGTASLVGTGS